MSHTNEHIEEEEEVQQDPNTQYDDRITFASVYAKYMKDRRAEEREIGTYGRYVTAELEAGAAARKEEAEDTSFLGDLFAGTLASTNAATTAYAAVGGGTRLVYDATHHAEDVDLTASEADYGKSKFFSNEYRDIYSKAMDYQRDLDDYDANQWKSHVADTLGGAYNVLKLATTGAKLGYDPNSIRNTLGFEELADEQFGTNLDFNVENFTHFNPETMLDDADLNLDGDG